MFCGKHNNADTAVAASKLLTNLKTVNTRHHNIKNGNIKVAVVFFVFLKCSLAAVSLDYIIACSCKVDNDKVTNCGLVLTNKNFFIINLRNVFYLKNYILLTVISEKAVFISSSLIESDVSSFTSAKAYAVLSFLYINV